MLGHGWAWCPWSADHATRATIAHAMAATTFSTTLRTSRADAIGTAIDAGGAAGTVSAGGGSVTGALAFTTDAVSLGAESQNIPPPSAFTVALDYRRPSVLQPVVRMPRVAGVPGGPRMRAAWWRR